MSRPGQRAQCLWDPLAEARNSVNRLTTSRSALSERNDPARPRPRRHKKKREKDPHATLTRRPRLPRSRRAAVTGLRAAGTQGLLGSRVPSSLGATKWHPQLRSPAAGSALTVPRAGARRARLPSASLLAEPGRAAESGRGPRRPVAAGDTAPPCSSHTSGTYFFCPLAPDTMCFGWNVRSTGYGTVATWLTYRLVSLSQILGTIPGD